MKPIIAKPAGCTQSPNAYITREGKSKESKSQKKEKQNNQRKLKRKIENMLFMNKKAKIRKNTRR